MNNPLPDTRGQLRPTSRRGTRLGLDPIEVIALGVVAAAWIGFGIYGVVTNASSTPEYLFVVAAMTMLAVGLRKRLESARLTLALALLAVAHLAGGLVRVGDEVLYNASLWSPVFQYDHFVHTTAIFLGVLITHRLVSATWMSPHRGFVAAFCVLAGLGLGAVNEMIEFIATLMHDGSGVGGYRNTGWDLVSNTFGALAAGALIIHPWDRPNACSGG